ncbi:hypothetical protein Lal_00020603 [Lupinus albus]|uniref:Uncharacterized protein n=1 Tax=Lupinus albus TaxID=3870 RepID=A0A6A5MH80_LUPAL|nr:hypothetical protein Lalb_Chr08g0244791 [Lupinus albus]KAF1871808.1 hypothetical protein Lal_00020603 [Lupinus albus]
MGLNVKESESCLINAQTPLALPFLKLIPPPITTVADNFFRSLNSFVSHNPFLNKFASLSSQFHTLCLQIRCSNSNRKMRSLSSHNFAAVLPGDSVAGLVVANGVQSFLSLYNTLLVVRLVLTWFPNSPPAIVSPLSTICDPYLNIFRGLIPPIGGTLDLSPILAFLVLNAFTSTAAALPAELPVSEQSEQVTTSQKDKWMRRIHGNRSISSGPVN